MHRIILSYVACLDLRTFSALSHKQDFLKKKQTNIIEHKMRVLIRSTTFVLNTFNPLNAQLNPIFHLLALLVVHNILYISMIRVNPKNSARYYHKLAVVNM